MDADGDEDDYKRVVCNGDDKDNDMRTNNTETSTVYK